MVKRAKMVIFGILGKKQSKDFFNFIVSVSVYKNVLHNLVSLV